MKVSRKQLTELIRLITDQVIKEYSTTVNDKPSDNGVSDGTDNPAMTSYEKVKAERESRKQRQDGIRSATLDLDSTKKQQDYFTQQAKKNKADIQAKQKELQALKGATSATQIVPAGGISSK